MVKVIEKTSEKIERDKKINELLGALEKDLGEGYEIADRDLLPNYFSVRHENRPELLLQGHGTIERAFSVSLTQNKIDVYSPKYLEKAIRAANMLEESEGKEYIVKKNY